MANKIPLISFNPDIIFLHNHYLIENLPVQFTRRSFPYKLNGQPLQTLKVSFVLNKLGFEAYYQYLKDLGISND